MNFGDQFIIELWICAALYIVIMLYRTDEDASFTCVSSVLEERGKNFIIDPISDPKLDTSILR